MEGLCGWPLPCSRVRKAKKKKKNCMDDWQTETQPAKKQLQVLCVLTNNESLTVQEYALVSSASVVDKKNQEIRAIFNSNNNNDFIFSLFRASDTIMK
ncbi:hypothetical protein ElyMa_000478700 [Elysia marginata]|uniref:Uncharacterized protein n=1 Tax=Elysia marginata TaxID=1093978 RepID=A0AAV4FVJ4_9GAST|nr:hypothetical protein ElyMa_000478700 [Elysia marginata]